MEKPEIKKLLLILATFSIFYFVPYKSEWFNSSIISGVNLLNDYAKEHVLTCLIPALFIAGAITVFIKKEKVMKYLGPESKKSVSYLVAAVSGSILAVCSCTILPIFAGIRKRGAGLGPATTFLFSGPAINIAAIFLTMNVLGFKIGLARVILAILISILTGITIQLIFREKPDQGKLLINETEDSKISELTIISFFLLMVGFLVVNGLKIDPNLKYIFMFILFLSVVILSLWKFKAKIISSWMDETWTISKMILPLLFIGVFLAGFIMPLLPEQIITNLVGKNNLLGNLVASLFGAFMYFSTLTEIPIIQALMSKGMHSGPALALLLAGPSLSLPNMLVIRKVLGNKKTIVYVSLVVFYSTLGGLIFGSYFF